uniref:Chromosome segregation ATPase-like protein n=1 Tax=uncultured organism TaxID=155900 RepID=M1QC69_9ZZZZ|nr:chromosome segregation ATPase-like protein [uncultured organism]
MTENIKAKVLQNSVIVSGHPRSGTSITCQLVESAGVHFPSDYEGDEYNESGYYELEISKDLSKKLIEKAMTIKNTIKMNQVIEKLNEDKGLSGLKLVRIPALFFYRHVADNLKAVFIFRNPADVKASMLRRGISSFEPDWFINNNALIAAYENIEDSILLSYETLLTEREKVKKLFQKIDLEIDASLIKTGQRSQKHSNIVLEDREIRLYEKLKELEAQNI